MLRKIRVLVVEDSLVFRELLVQNLNKDEGIEVVAAARDPFEARDMILKYQPDVMTLDIEMPRMDGIEFPASPTSSRPTASSTTRSC